MDCVPIYYHFPFHSCYLTFLVICFLALLSLFVEYRRSSHVRQKKVQFNFESMIMPFCVVVVDAYLECNRNDKSILCVYVSGKKRQSYLALYVLKALHTII